MTTRDELAALADDIELWRRGHSKDSEMFGYILHPSEQLPVIVALRLASRQEVSVEQPHPSDEAMKAAVELEIHAALGQVQTVVIGRLIQKAIDAYLAKYSITNRTE